MRSLSSSQFAPIQTYLSAVGFIHFNRMLYSARCAPVIARQHRQGDRMRRREFLTSGAALLSFIGSATALPSRPWRVAFVAAGIVGEEADTLRASLLGLGYEVGKNLLLDVREARGNFGLLADIMKEIVVLNPDVIVAEATPAIAAAKRATSTIPIVMAPATDPVGSGFIQSFPHPGGNITGLANLYGDQTAKTLEFLHLVLPQARRIGVLTSNNPTHPGLFETAKFGASNIGLSAERFIA